MEEVNVKKFKILSEEERIGEETENKGKHAKSLWTKIKEDKICIIAILTLLSIFFLILIGPIVSKYNYLLPDKTVKDLRPNGEHWFGTDYLGRDFFARVCKGGQISLMVAFVVAFCDVAIGGIYGAICGYFGGLMDDITMRIVEIFASIPNLLLIILVSLIFRQGMTAVILALAMTGWCNIARLVRGQVIQLKEQEFVLAAQALGASRSRVLMQHLVSNLTGIAVIIVSSEIPTVISSETLLSFIGFGIQEPDVSWGVLCSQGYNVVPIYPYRLFIPAILLSLTIVCFNLIGDRVLGMVQNNIN